uniref:Uncharacterized protein n=1 Tax=Romanomermis culicivorax TaxID=13658 RepID=A0A915K4L3_ROMCU
MQIADGQMLTLFNSLVACGTIVKNEAIITTFYKLKILETFQHLLLLSTFITLFSSYTAKTI